MQKKIPLKRLGILALVVLLGSLILFLGSSRTISIEGTLLPYYGKPTKAQFVLKINRFHQIFRQRIYGRILIFLPDDEPGKEYLRAKWDAPMTLVIDPHCSRFAVISPQTAHFSVANLYFDDSFDELAFTMEPYATFYSSEPFYQAVCERYELDTP